MNITLLTGPPLVRRTLEIHEQIVGKMVAGHPHDTAVAAKKNTAGLSL